MTLTLGNMGTALLWLSMFHLFLLNVVLGVIEGLLLAWWGRVGRWRAIGLMIVANYASAWAGLVMMEWLEAGAAWISGEGPLLYRLEWAMAVMLVALLALTVVLEWPCAWLALRRSERSWRARFGAVVVVNVITYAGLGTLYAGVSEYNVLTEHERVRDVARLTEGTSGWVYYITPDGRSLQRIRLDGSRPETLDAQRELVAVAAREGMRIRLWSSGGAQLLVKRRGPDEVAQELARVEVGRVGRAQDGVMADRPEEYSALVFDSPRGRRPGISVWAGLAEEGLREWQSGSGGGTQRRVVLYTPLYEWWSRFPTVLPDNQIVFEFGKQIMVLDDRGRIGALVEGVSPVVVLDAAE